MSLFSNAPQLYFRIREPGAAVFRVSAENQQKRMEMDLIAVANVRTGEIKSHGAGPNIDEREQIESWISDRRKSVPQRDQSELKALIESLNRSAQWLHSRANKKAVIEQAEDLLFALHDLRSVIVRRMIDNEDTPESED